MPDDDTSNCPTRSRWITLPDGVEPLGKVIEICDLTPEAARIRNAQAAEILARTLAAARKSAAKEPPEDPDAAS